MRVAQLSVAEIFVTLDTLWQARVCDRKARDGGKSWNKTDKYCVDESSRAPWWFLFKCSHDSLALAWSAKSPQESSDPSETRQTILWLSALNIQENVACAVEPQPAFTLTARLPSAQQAATTPPRCEGNTLFEVKVRTFARRKCKLRSLK